MGGATHDLLEYEISFHIFIGFGNEKGAGSPDHKLILQGTSRQSSAAVHAYPSQTHICCYLQEGIASFTWIFLSDDVEVA